MWAPAARSRWQRLPHRRSRLRRHRCPSLTMGRRPGLQVILWCRSSVPAGRGTGAAYAIGRPLPDSRTGARAAATGRRGPQIAVRTSLDQPLHPRESSARSRPSARRSAGAATCSPASTRPASAGSVAVVWLCQLALPRAAHGWAPEYAAAGGLVTSLALFAAPDLPIWRFYGPGESYRAGSLWPAVFFHSLSQHRLAVAVPEVLRGRRERAVAGRRWRAARCVLRGRRHRALRLDVATGLAWQSLSRAAEIGSLSNLGIG